MSIDRYRRKQLAKREGGPAATTPAGPREAPGAGSDSSSSTATETAVVQPAAPIAPTRDER